MTHRTINRTLAAVLFFTAVILYLRTMAHSGIAVNLSLRLIPSEFLILQVHRYFY